MILQKLSKARKNLFKGKDAIDKEKIPYHVAIIMDGNGRWAQKRGLPRIAGHRAGVQALKRTVSAAKEIGIQILTVYAFSTENWKRPKKEVQALMDLLAEHIQKDLDELHSNNIKINCIGKITDLPLNTQELIKKAEDKTKDNDGLVLNIALNYGGRAEIVEATKKVIADAQKGTITENDINEEKFASYLYTRDQKDPDLLIRPSGEIRISNFLLWQIAYAEIYFSPVFWPDFDKVDLIDAIIDYQKRDRRFGGLKK